MNTGERFLVTGAAGFIGSALVRQLIKEGHQVVSIDNLSTGSRKNVPDGVEFFEGDCQDPEIYRAIPNEPYRAIFHIAGQSSGEISFDNPVYDLRSNTESTLLLLKFALKTGCSRLIYASTMSVYGIKPDRPVKEIDDTKPESFYGVGKLASEQYLRIYERYGIRSTSLRLFNVYGPGQNMENLRQGMVSIFMSQMLDTQHINVKGDRDRFRDFIYIDDVVGAFMTCLYNEKSYGKVINIGTSKRTTVKDLIESMIRMYGKDVTVTYSGSTPGDIMGIYADVSEARRLMGFQAKFSLDDGLARMLKWAVELRSRQSERES